MAVDIVAGAVATGLEVVDEMVGACPRPVVGPEVDIAVVDIGIGADALIGRIVVLAAPRALTADGDEVVGVETADECRGLGQPFLKGGQRLLAERPWLVAYLPRHDGGVVDILHPRVAVGALQDEAHIIVEELMGLGIGSILLDELHIGRVAILIGPWSLSCPSMLKIEAISPTPLPGVVEIEHGHHIALAHLLKQEVETGEDGVVVDTWRHLQRRLHLGGDAPLAITAHEDAQVVDAHLLHVVEFLAQALTVAALSLATEDGTIPEVGAHVVVGLASALEMAIDHLDEWAWSLIVRTCAECESHEKECKDFLHFLGYLIIMCKVNKKNGEIVILF